MPSHEAAEALSGRLNWLLDNIDRLDRPDVAAGDLIDQWKEEAAAIVQALVGDDPRVLDSIRHLRAMWHRSDLVLREKESGDALVRLDGNEHWVFADVAVGDDYGALDFWARHAIWRNTGALYRVIHGNEVVEDPLYVPPGSPYTGPTEEEYDVERPGSYRR